MTLRAGLTGTGTAGLVALEATADQRDCAVTAVHDHAQDTARGAAKAYGIRFWTTEFLDLMEQGLDFLVVAGRLRDRLDQVRVAAENGLPCLLHAPAAPDLETMRAMVAITAEHGVRLGVYTKPHADPVVEQIRRMIAGDWLGGVTTVQAIAADDALLRGHLPSEPEDLFIALSSPHVHLATWLTGRHAQRVTAQTSRNVAAGFDDGAVATVVLRGEVPCTFSASRLARAEAFAVHGTDGGVRMAGDRIWLCGQRPFRGHVFDYDAPGTEQVLARRDIEGALEDQRAYSELHGRFARWLQDTDDYPVPGEQAVVDYEILAAMSRAARDGAVVEL